MTFNDKPMRRSQLISPFGVGAIVDFPKDTSVMIAGLDAWDNAQGYDTDNTIQEERLQHILSVSSFRLPPDESSNKQIPVIRFPRWHYCPVCGQMEKLSIFKSGVPVCKSCVRQSKPRLTPVRFVAACESGHLSDFPFFQWAHSFSNQDADPNDSAHKIRYSAGTSSTLSGIRVSCSCGASRDMGAAFDNSAFGRLSLRCDGLRPWLGEEEPVAGCGCEINTVQKGASNIYFPAVYSSIYLPLWGEKASRNVIKLVEDPKIWGHLTSVIEDGHISKALCNAIADTRGVKAEELYEVAQRKLKGGDINQSGSKNFRFAEYEAFLKERGGENTDLLLQKYNVSEYASDWLSDFFSSVVLVKKLRETRVLAGFTRLLPPGDLDSNEGAVALQPIKKSDAITWLPAMVVRGEGIFIEFNQTRIDQWVAKSEVSNRIANLMSEYNDKRIQSGYAPLAHDSKLFLLHTFAHSLIRQLCFECGYGSSALRERIYCSNIDNEKMCGILIYTAAGDSEGTMGGLVHQAEPKSQRLQLLIKKALEDARWCSADPICIESNGQGTQSSNLAACHNCSLLPETSCEQGNRFLDRAVMVGTPDNPSLGFFSSLFPR